MTEIINNEQLNLFDSGYPVTKIPTILIVAGNNDRTVFNQVEIDSLAASIKSDGLLQPPTVRPIGNGFFEIVAGERRVRACKSLGWPEIPCMVRELTDEQAAALMLAENVMRVDINPIEEANAYRSRMSKFGWTVKQTAENVNLPLKRVKDRLQLLELHPDVQKLIQTKQLGVTYGESMAGLDYNRQLIAMRVFSSGRQPTIQEFRKLCNQLLSEQSQDTLFDLESLWQNQLQTDGDKAVKWSDKRSTGLPVNPEMPKLDAKRSGGTNIGRAINRYVEQLQEAGMTQEALAVSTLLENLVQDFWTTV